MESSEIIQEIRDEIPGYAGAAIGTLDGSSYVADGSLVELQDTICALAKAWHATYEAAGGAVDLGSNDEVLTSASRAYVLLKVHHGSGRFVAVMLRASGNVGYLRFRMRAYLRRLVA